MADVKNAPAPKTELEGSTYQIIQKRLKKQAALLQEQLNQLNESRKQVFGAVETRLVGTNRITTANNCIPKDMVSVGKQFLFGYNVHIGLRSEIRLEDVFSLYRFEAEDHSFHQQELSLLADKQFEEDFKNLYKYYKHTVFAKFALVGPHLFMVFQVGKGPGDVKTFKWALQEHSLSYLGNRFDHEYKFPDQHEFVWKRTNRDMHRRGKHPHISILDRVFVETVGGDLTIKVEDNTDSGQGIYAEEVTHKEQTLDDAEVAYADLGNLIVLRIRPYQEKTYRYFIFNEKMQEALRVDSLEHACVLLPDEQGLIFANGYYLQTGEYKIFDHAIQDLQFERRISSPNGEDFLYVFYNPHTGLYVLLQYNLVNQQVATPILCHGFSLFSNGELCYFRAEDQPGRHHTLQIWQTPYTRTEIRTQEHTDSYLFKIGNKDIVRAMAECNELLTLIHKGDTYTNLYIDLVQHTQSMLDSYYWIKHPEAGALGEPLQAIGQIAAAAIDEFEKVRRIRQHTEEAIQAATDRLEQLLHQIKRHKAKSIEQYVHHLAELRLLRGEIIGLKELRYANTEKIELLEQQVAGQTQKLSADCIQFLLKDTALAPYREQLLQHEAAIAKVEKVAQAREAAKAIDQTAGELELLIEVVSNLKIEDATETTRIIEQISDIYAGVNQLRARLKTRRKALLSQEATAEFQAQLKLLEQAVVNYLELCDSPPKCDEYLTKLMVQLEELEGKFTEFDEFADQLAQKREEIYQAFESRKLSLTEARNKRANNLLKAAERILKGIQNRLAAYEEVKQIHAYFASDLMVEKVRDIIAQLQALEDSVKAGDIQARLKSVKEDAIRQLKDKNELFVAGNNLIQFGRHHFSVNIQPLDLTLLPREGQMYVHLSGTNFFEQIDQPELEKTRAVWEQSLLSENQQVYRAEYLAWQMFQTGQFPQDTTLPGLQQSLRKFMVTRYQEGYTKGIHDADAARILHELIQLHARIDLLRYAPRARACASLYWHSLMGADEKQLMSSRLKGVGIILELFPDTREFGDLVTDLQEHIRMFTARSHLFEEGLALEAGEYLFFELSRGQHFIISLEAAELYQSFQAFLKKQKIKSKFDQSIAQLAHAPEERFDLIRSWLSAFTAQEQSTRYQRYLEETAALLFAGNFQPARVIQASLEREIRDMKGDHPLVRQGVYQLQYHDFVQKMRHFERHTVPLFVQYGQLKKKLATQYREQLQLESFRPRVLSSFVRNQLIDQVYLPLIGDNLAKQIGTAGENTRTDRMGMLLLISPPGYGKTTLMEYIANRLGLIFMKINGPSIGHQVTALDPAEAPNAAARQELDKLSLALEMGDNIMLYLDDIQHLNPEFLQKFISLCDAQRKIEGVYKGKTRTYDLRGKKVAVVMAGNPYTESGEKFQIPDMLANRADTYNLGDIIGDNDQSFKLSYIENALTSNPILNRLSGKAHKDILALIRLAETGREEDLELESNIPAEELNEYVSVLKKLLVIRDVVLKVNQAYIRSAAQQDAYRTEPPFQLQGSYRNMNKLAEKVAPIMNEGELRTLILSHYENEAQTLTSGAEANLLKFKQLCGYAQPEDARRWEEILQMFRQQKLLNADRLGQMVQQMGAFTEGLSGIRQVLEAGIKGSSKK